MFNKIDERLNKQSLNARAEAVLHRAWSFIGMDLLYEIGMIISSLNKGNVLVNAYSAQYGKMSFAISADEFRFNSEKPDRTALKREAKEFEELMIRKKKDKKGCD